MINIKQIQLIHVAKTQLKLDDELYREILTSRYGTNSSKNLTNFQANDLIEHFKRKGFKPTSMSKPRKKADGVIQLITPRQTELIEVLKANIVWHAGADGFDLWLKKRMRINKVATKQEAARVIEGLKGMLGIDSDIIEMRALPFPISAEALRNEVSKAEFTSAELKLDESYFINLRTGEILPFRWVYDLEKRKLVKVINEQI